MATYKGELKQKTGASSFDILYPTTSADVVVYNSTTVKDALDALNNGSLFWVTYNSTPYADITNALAAGKLPICKYNNNIYIYTTKDANVTITGTYKYHFATIQSNYSEGYSDPDSTVWTIKAFDVDNTTSSAYSAIYEIGFAHLDSNGKIVIDELPDIVLGNMLFGGTITFSNNNATAQLSTNGKTRLKTTATSVTLTGAASSTSTNTYGWVATEGMYFLASANGTFKYTSTAEATDFNVGDWLVSTGTAWTKVDNVDAVTGVKGNAETTYRTGNINLTAANVGAAASSHTHGNITNAGALQTTDVAIANGDKLVITDANNSNKIARSSLAFDGSTTTSFLSKKGTWETVAVTDHNQTVKVGSITFGADAVVDFTSNNHVAVSTSTNSINYGLELTGIAPGTYSAVAVDAFGIVTAGQQAIAVINHGATPSNVVVNGWYFEKAAT